MFSLLNTIATIISTSYFLQSIADYYMEAYYRQISTLSSPFPGKNQYLVSMEEIIQEHRLAGADRSSIFFLKVKGLSFSITKEGGVE
ncbi:hypothetical protein DPMN_095608 [Dreissena polymorpha]|uniref:Uncharacterized protein n=1 Tax=Dreissena polymorpha TaxID=45954 RepID=A0A9D4L6T8_DREPO|nr:hypothetical protein DPMN_095608 [Dreissena polymorpha]